MADAGTVTMTMNCPATYWLHKGPMQTSIGDSITWSGPNAPPTWMPDPTETTTPWSAVGAQDPIGHTHLPTGMADYPLHPPGPTRSSHLPECGRHAGLLVKLKQHVMTLMSYYSPYLECLMVKCHVYYLPQEFTSAILTEVYIPYHTEVKNTQTPWTIATTNDIYCSIPGSHFGKSDQNAVLLLLADKHNLKHEDQVQKVAWSEVMDELQSDCLESVDWSIFKNTAANLKEHAITVISFIS
eukprot:g46104.t1